MEHATWNAPENRYGLSKVTFAIGNVNAHIHVQSETDTSPEEGLQSYIHFQIKDSHPFGYGSTIRVPV